MLAVRPGRVVTDEAIDVRGRAEERFRVDSRLPTIADVTLRATTLVAADGHSVVVDEIDFPVRLTFETGRVGDHAPPVPVPRLHEVLGVIQMAS